jgi:hypothetical protein
MYLQGITLDIIFVLQMYQVVSLGNIFPLQVYIKIHGFVVYRAIGF